MDIYTPPKGEKETSRFKICLFRRYLGSQGEYADFQVYKQIMGFP